MPYLKYDPRSELGWVGVPMRDLTLDETAEIQANDPETYKALIASKAYTEATAPAQDAPQQHEIQRPGEATAPQE